MFMELFERERFRAPELWRRAKDFGKLIKLTYWQSTTTNHANQLPGTQTV